MLLRCSICTQPLAGCTRLPGSSLPSSFSSPGSHGERSAAPGLSCPGWVLGFLLLRRCQRLGRHPPTLAGAAGTLAGGSGKGWCQGAGSGPLYQLSQGCQEGGEIKSQPSTQHSLGGTEKVGSENSGWNWGWPCPRTISRPGLNVVVTWVSKALGRVQSTSPSPWPRAVHSSDIPAPSSRGSPCPLDLPCAP